MGDHTNFFGLHPPWGGRSMDLIPPDKVPEGCRTACRPGFVYSMGIGHCRGAIWVLHQTPCFYILWTLGILSNRQMGAFTESSSEVLHQTNWKCFLLSPLVQEESKTGNQKKYLYFILSRNFASTKFSLSFSVVFFSLLWEWTLTQDNKLHAFKLVCER